MADLTNDQITAGAAVLAIPTAILHLPCNRTMSHFATVHEMNSYKEGHRDARHAAADLVLARADELKALAAPSPQVADIAVWDYDLMGVPNEEVAALWRSCGHSGTPPYSFANRLQEKLRDAIAASRRAAGGGVVEALRRVCTHEKRSSAQINQDWDRARAVLARYESAPASAGQAAPADARSYREEEFLTAARVALVALAHAAEKHGIYQTDHDRFAAAVEKFAAQPAEGAGQAGQVAKGPDQQQIEWSNDLQGRLIDLSQDMTESEDARQVMAEAACLLASLTGHAVSQ